MNIYYYNPDTGVYAGQGVADESPLEENVWLVPAYATPAEPPSVTETTQAVYVNNAWEVQTIPQPEPEPEPEVTPPPTPSELRRSAFVRESDALFFKAQRGEATMEEWLAKISEIKARYPDPE